MRALAGVGVGVVCAALIACASSKAGQSAAPASAMPTTEAGAPPTAMGGGDLRAQIEELDQAIDGDLADLMLSIPVPACVAAASCGAVAPVPFVKKPTEDPACQPSPSDTCTDVCTLSDSICSNADRICKLATQLGGADAYANEKCAKGNASCDAARERCCGCV